MEPKMNIGTQIKKYRNGMGLSQEELAGKIFVSRQTVSNWENNKNYPDIHSLLLLGSLFNVSLDNLIKGDIDIMKEEIKVNEEEIKKFNRYSAVFGIFLIASVLLAVPLSAWLGLYAVIPWGIIYGTSLVIAIKIEKIKKENCTIAREGKNWYATVDGQIFTVNAYSYTIITAHRCK